VFALVFSFAEAYVDAALMDFDDEFEGVEKVPEGDLGLRMGYQIHF
jgi:hypothetical protein